MPSRLKPGKKVERFVPSKSHDAKVIAKTGELCVGIEVGPDDSAIITFRVKGRRQTFSAPVDSLYRKAVQWQVAYDRMMKAKAKKERREERKAETRRRRELKRLNRKGRTS